MDRLRKDSLVLFTLAPMTALVGACLSSTVTDTPKAPPPSSAENGDAIAYRDLASHPGCTTAGLSYTAAQISGYDCAAKEYALPVAEDTTKPIVLLIHGNSSTPGDWERFPADSPTPMLSERLVAAGIRTYAIDMRMDKTDDPTTNDPKTGNPAHNMDHGWGVPLIEHFIEAVLNANPKREISIVGFSYGPTAIRDALRRLHRDGKKPFERVNTLVLASGANHGVSTYRKKCVDPANPANVTMAGHVACEMGDRTSFELTDFLRPLNGEDGAWETPCADGDSAYGQGSACAGHKVHYVTIVMRDPPQGALQDEFVSERSARLEGADNLTVELSDQDQTGYFYNGAFKNHFGSIRSDAGLVAIMNALSH
jgi:pimeloyl-ACP methyl ester carboxylesterase